MLGLDGCIVVGQLLEQSRRALDVREQEGHRAGGEAHAAEANSCAESSTIVRTSES
jgi:hypothetical protein